MSQNSRIRISAADHQCPVCSEMFSKSGLPNHLRGHYAGEQTPERKKSSVWWRGWLEGYKAGLAADRIPQGSRNNKSSKTE